LILFYSFIIKILILIHLIDFIVCAGSFRAKQSHQMQNQKRLSRKLARISQIKVWERLEAKVPKPHKFVSQLWVYIATLTS